MNAKGMRRLIAVGIGLGVIALVVWQSRGAASDGDWTSVKRRELVVDVETRGTLQAVDSIKLGPNAIPNTWNFKVSFLEKEGKIVEEGDVVVGFDATELQQQLRDKKDEYDKTVEELAKARIGNQIRSDEDKMQLEENVAKLTKAGLKTEVPPELAAARDLRKAKLEHELAVFEVEHLKKRLNARQRARQATISILEGRRDRAARRVEEIEESIARMNVLAPKGGTLIHLSENGEKMKVGDQCWRGRKVVEIPDLTRMEARAEVDEADAGRVALGQAVRFRLEAHPDVEFTGKVASIERTVRQRSWRDKVKVVKLVVALDKTDTTRMSIGMRFKGRIELDRIDDLVLIPSEAVFSRPEGPMAWRKDFGPAEAVPLELGRRNDDWVEVIAGLDPEDKVSRVDLSPRRDGT